MKEEKKKYTLEALQDILTNVLSLIDQISSQINQVKSVKFSGSFLAGFADLINSAVKTIELIEEIENSEELKELEKSEEERELMNNIIMKKSDLYTLLGQIKSGENLDVKKTN